MVLAPSATALRCVTRAAVSSARKLAPQRPANNLMMSRPLCSIGSLSIYDRTTNNDLTSKSLSTVASSLSDSLSHLSLHQQHQQKSPFSTHAAKTTVQQQQQPLGEPITFLTLSNLADNPGAVKKKRRVGRGIGSSKGKTCGRGHKGQKARAGKGVHPTFEGGQTKFYKRMPKIGKMKNSRFKLNLIPINVGTVQNYITMGRLRPERSDGVITMKDMVNAGMFPNSAVKSGVKLLGDGKEWLRDKLHIEVPWASATAIEAIESKGGFVTTVHYNRLALRAHLKPHKFPVKPEAMLAREKEDAAEEATLDLHDMHLLPKRARPPTKYMPYYTDYAKRGYLNPKVQLERKKRGLKEIH
mmetsp:Transcript_26194/g.54714  ORF Transcript_26194/g.54714 Transcript_26194/m.54714 type:complete len:356 (-) Transcript_26194:286-1353(-)